MPCLTLPNGDQKQFDELVTMQTVAESIGARLAAHAVAAVVDGEIVDLSYEVSQDAEVKIITLSDPEGLEVIRHSTAHILAQAVKRLFPEAQVTIGPVIEHGFYYDFSIERPFVPEDLPLIESAMKEIVAENLGVVREEVPRDEAIAIFQEMGEHYKVEIIKAIPEGDIVSLYRQGDFVDLCRGPHVPRTGMLKAFQLTKIAGAYWRGDSANEMLQRIYGTAWDTPKALKAYLHQVAEAEKRDHRLLAQKMDLFHLQKEAPGMVFWHPNGWSIISQMRSYVRRVLDRDAYQEVNTPQLVHAELWERSGHKSKFGDDMFSLETEHGEVVIKPMSCPCHVQIFKQRVISYRELPIRLSEFGCCHRNEPSGSLHGLMRVRGFVQDDAHIFCTEEQIESEVSAFIDLLHEVYARFGFTEVIYKLSTRPEKRIGSDAIWDHSEEVLAKAMDAKGLEWELLPGEGAFYGPKIEFSLKDCLGRVWQCGTIQVDFSMPERLGATYIDEESQKRHPVMLHRAILGSFERFLAIILEQYDGRLPLWLAPVQVMVITVTDRQLEYGHSIVNQLKKADIRVDLDLRNEKIGFKIRDHTIRRVPLIVVLGDKEQEQQSVTVRSADGQSKMMSTNELISYLSENI